MSNIDLALEQLSVYDTDDALLALEALEGKRREQHFAKYWSSDDDPNHSIFFQSIEDCFAKFTPDVKIFGLLGGNRSSKTERGAFIAVAYLMGKEYFRGEPAWRYVQHLPIPEHGCNIWAVGLDFSVIRDVIWNEKLRRGHQHPGLLPVPPCREITRISDSEFQVQVDVNGRKSTLTCKSAEAGREKMQSASIDLVWIDEECDVEVYDELYQRTVDCGGKILITLTPLSDIGSGASRPWVFELHREFRQGRKDVVFVQLSALDNPFIPEIEKQKLKEKWAGHPEERARLYGDFIKRSGLVYPMWDKSKHIIKKQTIPFEWRRIACIDPAAAGVTAVVWCAISPRNDVYLYRTYYERNKIVSDHAKDILLRTGSERIDVWLIDPFWGVARNAETHKQGYQLFKEAGIPVRLAPRAEDFGRDTMAEYLNATLDPTARHPKLYVMDGNPEFVDEIEQYQWDFVSKGPMKGLSKDKPRKLNDHAINALQYLLSTKPKGKLGSGVTNVGTNDSYT
jgi:phage terminase large subunit-like protein